MVVFQKIIRLNDQSRSFIGYSSAFPKLIKDVYGYLPDGSVNPAMEGAAPRFAWMGPCIGSLSRPIGGWLSDKFSGAAVTHWGTIVETLSTIGAGYFVKQAMGADKPEEYFFPFLICFLLLFCSTGSSNGSSVLKIRSTSNSLLHTSTSGSFSAVSTPIFASKY